VGTPGGRIGRRGRIGFGFIRFNGPPTHVCGVVNLLHGENGRLINLQNQKC